MPPLMVQGTLQKNRRKKVLRERRWMEDSKESRPLDTTGLTHIETYKDSGSIHRMCSR